MSQPTEEELFQPQFAALESCLLVDPRHGSRNDLRRDLKSSNLFENIVEAKSLDDSIRVISNHVFDAFFVGPSLAQEKTVSLLRQIKSVCFSPDCALIVMIPREPPIPHDEYILAGAHRVIEIPCPRSVFMECVVRGVVSANANSSWSSIVKKADASGVNLFGEEVNKSQGNQGQSGHMQMQITQPRPKPPPPAPPEPPPPPPPPPSQPQEGTLNRATINSVIAQSAPGLKQLLKEIERGAVSFDASGRPDAAACSVIESLLDSILKSTDLDSKAPGFRTYFQNALLEWVSDVKIYGQADATNELRKRLLAFKM